MTQTAPPNPGGGPLEPFVPRPRRFTVNDLESILDTGVLFEGQRIELMNGLLLERDLMQLRRFSVQDFEAMLEAGIVREGERVELIQGVLLEMNAMFNPHYQAMLALDDALRDAFGGKARIANQLPLRLHDETQPLPDFYLLPLEHSRRRIAHAHEALLLIEISDSTLGFDRRIKLKNYALSRVREYWILDLNGRRLEVYRQPEGEQYFSLTTLNAGTPARPLEFPDLEIRWDVALLDPQDAEPDE